MQEDDLTEQRDTGLPIVSSKFWPGGHTLMAAIKPLKLSLQGTEICLKHIYWRRL